MVVYFRVGGLHLVAVNFCLQYSERIIKIGQYMPKLCSNEKWSSFYSQCIFRTTTKRLKIKSKLLTINCHMGYAFVLQQ